MAETKTGLAQAWQRLLPSLGQAPVIGLSIEGNDLRLIYVRNQAIERIASPKLDSALMPGGMVADPAAFGSAVRAAVSAFDLPRAAVVAGFPDTGARSKIITLPKTASQRIAEVVQRQARQDPVMGTPDYRLFHQVVAEGANEISVFALALQRVALDNFIAGLRLGGVAPQRLEWRPLAIMRAINQPHIMIAHVERPSVDVIIVSNNLPVIVRSVPLSDDEATIVPDVVRELQQTIDAYNHDHAQPLSPHLPIALTGELADAPDLRPAIEEQVGHPVASPTCPFKAAAGFAVASFITPIGLALKAR